MKWIGLASVSLNQTPLDWEGNERRARAALADARSRGASLVLLPEMALSGYGCEDAFLGMGVAQRAWDGLLRLLPDTRGLVVSVGLPVAERGAVYNCAALCVDGALVGLAVKRHLAGDGIHYEPRWFRAGRPGELHELVRGELRCPMGDLLFDVGGVRIGFEICEDAWVVDRPGAALAAAGVDILLNPSASHFAFGKQDVRERLVVDGSRAFSATTVYANLLGNEAGRVIYDGGGLVASGGSLLAASPRLSFADHTVALAPVDVELTRRARAALHSHAEPAPAAGPQTVSVDFAWPALDPSTMEASPRAPRYDKPQEFARAVALGLHDYQRKSRARGFVVSLSGGADSASCAVLVRLSWELAVAELGTEVVAERLGLDPGAPDTWSRRLLLTAYQGTQNSGAATRAAAAAVAEGVGSEHVELEVGSLVDGYVRAAEAALGRELSWEEDDLQNIQARVRAPSVWLFANVRNALLLTTSNRSEAAVGYATMDGDTSGGLAPLAGIDKAYLREWLVWMEREGLSETGAFGCLSAVNALAPTAELRPPGEHQTDEEDLMPYPVLDAVERLAIRDKRAPAECVALLSGQFPAEGRAQIVAWVTRFFRLWSRNQWKRERYAPSFHLDDENLDPKTWCRFPILSGGFEQELAELEAEIA